MLRSVPVPAGAVSASLRAVACVSRVSCTAVGSFVDAAGETAALVKRWDGRTWKLQSAAIPVEATASALNGVSCPIADTCIAVGQFTSSAGTPMTLAERWNGTGWSLQGTSTPGGATASTMLGVARTRTLVCTAVGDFSDSTGTEAPLSERYCEATLGQPSPRDRHAR